MIHSVFELGDTIVREVMVPRPDMVVIEHGRTLRQAVSLALRSGFSRIPVIGDGMDDILGVVYLKDVTRRIYEHREGETTEQVESVMRPAVYVPDSKPAAELLRDMQAQRTPRRHRRRRVRRHSRSGDDRGRPRGDRRRHRGRVRHRRAARSRSCPNGDVRVSARLDIWDFAARFGLHVDEDDDEDVETVGGLLGQAARQGTDRRIHAPSSTAIGWSPSPSPAVATGSAPSSCSGSPTRAAAEPADEATADA